MRCQLRKKTEENEGNEEKRNAERTSTIISWNSRNAMSVDDCPKTGGGPDMLDASREERIRPKTKSLY
jgi:hypothetical protein